MVLWVINLVRLLHQDVLARGTYTRVRVNCTGTCILVALRTSTVKSLEAVRPDAQLTLQRQYGPTWHTSYGLSVFSQNQVYTKGTVILTE